MPGYLTLTTARLTDPDPVALLAAIRTATSDPTAVLLREGSERSWRGKKANAWTPAETALAQTLLDTTPAVTPQQTAQRTVDTWPIEYRALVLALIDQLNVIRAALTVPLPPITPTQALTAVRNKAATLN